MKVLFTGNYMILIKNKVGSLLTSLIFFAPLTLA